MDCNPLNSIVMQNNVLNIPTMHIASYFADKISKVDRVYDVNLLGLKTPIIFKCSKEEELTLKNIINDIYSNVPILVTKKKFDLNQITDTLDTKIEFNLDNFRNEKNSIMNEFLTFIGINNININKKERLVEAEANGNNELIGLDLDMFLSKRKEAVREINALFGTNIEVEAEQNIIKKFNQMLENLENKKGGENNDTSKDDNNS